MLNARASAIISAELASDHLEMWGGVECTCNRVRGRYFDQMELSGHASRLDDYEHFARLGIEALRIGLLWERHARTRSWGWFDTSLKKVQELGIRPIAGLVHHGSGPKETSLLDPLFPEKLADYAIRVADRYPWIDAYTPVNEPNTTARFSGMYGIWYPHHRSGASYLRALINQARGTVLSMRAIRRVRSDAKLIQTDDLGKISGTEELRPTWELFDLRQWLTFDLLCGCVDRHHPMYAIMRAEGLGEADILWFTENPCPPDVVGINYYVTSDRYLDHRMELYPEDRTSAEGSFIDAETVRVHGQNHRRCGEPGMRSVAPLRNSRCCDGDPPRLLGRRADSLVSGNMGRRGESAKRWSQVRWHNPLGATWLFLLESTRDLRERTL